MLLVEAKLTEIENKRRNCIFITVFARCLNTFCKTSLIVPKLYTQVNMTQHWEIYHSHLCQIEALLSKPKFCYQNLTFLCQSVTLMTKWHILASYADTFRSGGTTLYKTLQSLIFTVYSEGILSGGTFSNN